MADELYAHALIELEDGSRIQRGAKVRADLPGLDELKAGGAVSSEPYDETQDQLPPPEEVEIEGFVYKRAEEAPATVGDTGDTDA